MNINYPNPTIIHNTDFQKSKQKNFFIKNSPVLDMKKYAFSGWFLFMMVFGLLFSNTVFAQLNDCGTGVGGELTVGSSCSPIAFNSTNGTDYWNGANGCNGTDRDDAWGWFDAIATSTTITYSSPSQDPILHLFTGTCSQNMSYLACSDDNINASADETITYATTIGNRYYIRIQRYNSNGNMFGNICVYSPIQLPTISSFSPSSGCVSTASVVITGTNFTGATAVTIGGTNVSSYTVNTSTQITATVGIGTTGTIKVTTPSGTATSSGTFTVIPTNTIGNASSTPSLCINTPLTAITHATNGATGIGTPTGLPAGVSASWSSNTITISGNPTASGTFNYSIPLIGGCGTVNATGTITVNPNNTVASASSTPTLCINSALTAITHATTGATAIGTPTGLPFGVSASWASNTITISGIPTNAGTFNYTIPLSGGCGTISATGTITVNPNNTVSVASSTPTLCINSPLTAITHTTTGATGIGSPTGLPAGVTASWASNTITISGTPTNAGTFNYTIPITGCGNINATGTITVNTNTAGSASSTPTLCISTGLTAITHATTGATGIGTPTGLPAGVSAAWTSNAITISGTPTASGTFNYTIPLTGGCGNVNATGTIKVTSNNTVSAASSSPTLCVNILLTNITHTTAGATNISNNNVAGANGLPAGVKAVWTLNTITISGTPTASGTFNYSIPLTGGCGSVNTTGTIKVNPNNTVSAASSNPTLCINSPLTAITHTTTGATGIGTPTGLPAGVSASWASNTITISGSPTASGTFNYTIPLTGGCSSVNATGTINVLINTVGVASSTPTLCINTVLTNITHATTGATGIGTPTGLPAGVNASWSSNTITISGTPTASGTFNYTVPLTGGCGVVNATGTIIVNPTASTISLVSAVGTNNQNICSNSALTNIRYNIGGSATGATVSTLPAGISGSFSAGVFTISGTPTVFGVFNYTVSTTGGCSSGVTANGTITIKELPTVNAVANLTNCIGVSVPSTVFFNSMAGSTYNWTSSVNVGFGTIGSGNIPSFTTANATANTVVSTVSVRATNNGCQGPATTFTITVYPSPSVNAITNLTYCNSVNAPAINFGSATAGVSYDWTSTVDVGFGTSGSGNIATFTTDNATVTNAITTVSVRANINGCQGPARNFTVTVRPSAVVNAISDFNYCRGISAPGITFSSTTTGVTYAWTSTINVGFGTSGIGNINTYTTLNATTNPVTTTVSVNAIINGCPGPSTTFTVTVNPTPLVTGTLANLTYCNGDSAPSISFASSTSGVSYSWTSSIDVGFGTVGTGDIPTFTATNTTAAAITSTISVRAIIDGCLGTIRTFTIRVNPSPIVNAKANLTFCNGVSALTNIFSSTTSGTVTYSWTSSVNVGFGLSGTGNLPAFTTNNATANPVTTTVSVIATASGCPGAVTTFTVTVDPTAIVDVLPNLSYCTGASAPLIDFTSATTGVTYAWTSTVNIGFGTAGNGDIPAFTATNSLSTVLTSTISVRATINGCQGPARIFTITVSPSAIVNAKTALTYCHNASAPAVTFASTTTGVTFAWTSTLDVGFGTSGIGNIPAFTAANSTASAVTATVSVSAVINGCSGTTRTFTITVNPLPEIEIRSDYCSAAGKVELIASSNIPVSSWLWSTGETTSSILVDIVGVYTVTGILPSGCSSSSNISVAQELVINGSFTAGNTAFISGYTYQPDVAGNSELVPDAGTNGYAVGTNANNYHNNFWGIDHTNNSVGPRNFMIVNGHGTITLWQETVTVQANTDYYFSAWAMSLNNSGPYARLRFEINGVQVGTTAILGPGPTNATEAANNTYWKRFYSNPTWNSGALSGPVTIRIVNLEFALGGNDFGLDDISFGTLIPFIKLTSASGTDAQTVCQNSNITPVTYSVGGGITGPTVSTLPAGITSAYLNGVLTISGTPTVSGPFTYTVTTTGCAPVSVTGTITVNPVSTIVMTSGTQNQTVCASNAITNTVYTFGGSATNASVSGLPAGLSSAVNTTAKTVTISGTPTASGTYTITTSGHTTPCTATTIGGTNTVNPASTIVRTSGTQNQTVCASNAITNTVYTFGGSATNATVSGLPVGLSSAVNITAKTVTISGTPTASGTYTITTIGHTTPCTGATIGGTITVNAASTIVLTSGNQNQTVCASNAITNTVYTFGGSATNATVFGLPAGLSSAVNTTAKTVTISGTPTASGTYTITTSGHTTPCTAATIGGIITYLGKTWLGNTTDWNTATNWSPNGVPNATNCVVIPNTTKQPVISTNALANTLTIENKGILTVNSTKTITVTNEVTVNTGGTFILEDSASLIQVNNVSNTVTGTFSMTRITQPMYRYDYTYWGSPLTASSNYTLGKLTPDTRPDKYYSWLPSVGAGTGNWKQESIATVMNPLKGYIARAPDTYSTNPATKLPYTAVFTGTPNNGNIAAPVSCGTMGNTTQDDKWNLLGNPYPSAINALAFLTANGNIEGSISLWTHGSPILPTSSPNNPNPFYGTFAYNYSPNDMLTYNGSGSVPAGFSGQIASGQGFMVSMLKASCNGLNSSVSFNNTMRSSTYGNANFYKSASKNKATEKNRIWLSMVDKNKIATSAMVGYIEGATNENDRLYDAIADIGTTMKIYSLLDNTPLTIQGRAVSFDVNEVVPLGMKVVAPGTYSIAIDQVDGLFDTQDIYLEDKLMNVIHDLKTKQYDFVAAIGTFNDRFLIRYTPNNDNVLDVKNPNALTTTVIALINKDKINIQASENIKKVQVFDIGGKLIKIYTPKNSSKTFVDDFYFSDGIYLAKIKLENGMTETRKLANGEY